MGLNLKKGHHQTSFPHNIINTVCHLLSTVKARFQTFLVCQLRHQRWAFVHSSWFQQQRAVGSTPWLGRPECVWASLRCFLTVCTEILWFCKPAATLIIQVKKPVLEVLVWRGGYTWSVVVRLVVCAAKLSETTLETAYHSEMNFQFPGNRWTGEHSCGQYVNHRHPQNGCHRCVEWWNCTF